MAACPMAPIELEVGREINRVRAENGQAPLEIDLRLVQSALMHSRFMSDENRVATQLPGEATPQERMAMQSYPSPFSEVVAGAPFSATAADIVALWMAGAEKDILLSPTPTHLGIGSFPGATQNFWTVDFGSATEAAQSGDCSLAGGGNGTPVAAFTGPAQAVEGTLVAFDASRSSDPDSDPLMYTWDFGDGSTGSGVSPSHQYADNGSYVVELTVEDGRGGVAVTSQVITVTNATPVISALNGPTQPIEPGKSLTVTGAFSDAGVLDSHVVQVDWGDGTTSAGTVTGTTSKTFSAAHTYANAGTRTVTAIVIDNDGASSTRTLIVTVAAPQPSSGKHLAAGAGWINVGEGSYGKDSHWHGRAAFAFSARNTHGVAGVVTLHLPDLDFRFTSTTATRFEVVSKNLLVLEGTGWLNGRKGYSYLLTARARDRGDALRIKVWETSTGKVVFDSQPGDPDDAEPTKSVYGYMQLIRLR